MDGDFYNKDLNNFGPTVGFAWDLDQGRPDRRPRRLLAHLRQRGDGHGRTIGFARQRRPQQTPVTLSNQFARVAAGVPTIATPAFLSTRTLADQMLRSAPTRHAVGHRSEHERAARAPGQRRHPARARLVDGRRSALRRARSGAASGAASTTTRCRSAREFLADFNRARQQRVPGAAGGTGVQPGVQPGRSGQPAADTCSRASARRCTNATLVSNLQTNQVAGLADFYMTSRVAALARPRSCRTPASTRRRAWLNGGFSDYNSHAARAARQFRNGFFGQVNYTWRRTPRPTRRHGTEPLRGVHGQLPPRAQHRPLGVPRHARDQRPTRSTSCRSAAASGG